MAREIKGVDALAKAFPAEWLLYVSLNCFPRNQSPMEIDVLVVTDQCVLILEIKDWNGKLTSSGDRWFINGQSRGRSPVVQSSEKAKKLKTVLKGELGPIGKNLWVDHRVVLTGSANKQDLPPHEAQYVWSLVEACAIGDPIKRKNLLGSGRLSLFKLCQLETEFDRVTGNAKLFQPLEADWGGFQVVERDIFVHPRGIWQDHRGERRGETRIKAMIRTWSFDKLPPGLNSADTRRLVAHRETKAFAYLQEMGSDLVTGNRVMREISAPHDEVLTQHFEVRSVVQGWTTLDRYLERARDDLSLQDRFVIAAGLLNLVSQLHRVSVIHRDLGPRALWIGSPSDMALTGLMSCQLPDQGTVADWLTDLRGYASPLPEDRTPGVLSTGRQRDVYLVTYLVVLVIAGQRPDGDIQAAIDALPSDAKFLSDWLRKGLASDPACRFDDAISLTEEFSALIEPKQPAGVDQALLDRFDNSTNPYTQWMVLRLLSSKAQCTLYVSQTADGKPVTVKVWNGLRRGISVATDLALLRLLDSASRVHAAPINGLPTFLDMGLSPVGPYIVYEHCEGEVLSNIEHLTITETLTVGVNLMAAVTALHDLECDHGDVSPSNVIFERATQRVTLVDPFDLSAFGDGSVCTPAMCPPNWETWSQQSLDRYACLKVLESLIDKSDPSQLAAVAEAIKQELARPIVESLEPAAVAFANALKQIKSPAPLRIEITTVANTNGFEGGRGFFVQREEIEGGRERVTVTNSHGQLQMEGDGEHVLSRRFQHPSFAALAHQSRAGKPVDIEVAVARGEEDGFDNLYRHLRESAPSIEEHEQKDEPRGRALDVPWQWRRLIELEEQARVEVGITEIIGVRDGVVVCRYENLGRDFDFDAEAAVEVYNGSNKRVGEVDRNLSDFPSSLAVRVEARRVEVGDRLRLVDRREQSSIDRRARAVTRILEGRSIIPNLIDYFQSDLDVPSTKYPLSVIDEDLSAYSLNDGQKNAFLSIIENGPVGLLQGPPGTGKTRFIAAFVHWLLTKGGSQRILIASQSHEAVNNAIDSLLTLFKRLGGRPNLLRIGSKGITDRIKPYHSAELRERYRVRFEAAAKYRFSQLTSAKGISRSFASELFDLDSTLGVLARRCAALRALIENEDGTAAERERHQTQLRRVEAAFKDAAKQILGESVDADDPLAQVEQATKTIVAKHSDVSPADVTGTKQILALTRDWLSSLASPQRNFEEFLAKTRNVVTATCVGVGQTRIRIDSQVFDWVIVDEAARCTPGELAVPIQMARRVLLVGDHLQLKPMLSRDLLDILEEESSSDEPRGELEASDFERAFTSEYGRAVGSRFTEQYRMDPAICRMVSKCFYEPHAVRLTTSPLRVGGLATSPTGARWLASPMTWVDTSSHARAHESRPHHSTTRYNDAEVEAILWLLEDIASDAALVDQLCRGEDETPIGVICMYAGQKARLDSAWVRHAWDPRFRRLVRIDTVDSYQGKENAIVILSLVCNNKYGDIGHVKSPNRCNVAVSRARERLAIVGAKSMWERLSSQLPMASVLNYMKQDQANAVILGWEELR